MEITLLQVGSYYVNCAILAEDKLAWIVDPGSDSNRILSALKKKSLTPVGLLLTHAHFDHIGGIGGLQAAFPGLPVFVHPLDVPAFAHPANQMPPDYPPVPQPRNLQSVEALTTTSVPRLPAPLAVIETPGHTPGSVCYHFSEEHILFSGDTLFAGSVGRTDLPGGNAEKLMHSLEKLKALPPETLVYPGHGMPTTLRAELAGNPFLR